MNSVIEQKLKDLLEESLKQNSTASHAVIHLLYASHLNGTQNEFAKWCCKFSSGLKMQAGIDGCESAPPQGFDDSSESNTWIC